MGTPDDRPALLICSNGELLGDALLKLPALTALRPAFPDHRIIWLAGSGYTMYARQLAPLASPLVDEVREDVRIGQSLKELFQPPLGRTFVDVIIDTQSRIKSALILKRVPHRLFVSPAAGFILSDRKPPEPYKQGSVQSRLLRLISLAAGAPVQARFTLQLPAEYRTFASELLPNGRVYIGLAPGSGGARKCWPLEKFIALARAQQAAGRTPVFFLGPQETGWKDRISADVPGALFPEQAERRSELNGVLLSLALAERIQTGVANDSGTGHIFATAGQPLISLFGHTNAEKFVHDYGHGRRITIVAADYGGAEMHHIPVDAVERAIQQLLTTHFP